MNRSNFFLIFLFQSVFGLFSYTQNFTSISEIESEIERVEKYKDSLIEVKEDLLLKNIQATIQKYGLAKINKGEEIIHHSAMSLVYDEKHEQAKWVVHVLSNEILGGNVGRTNDFRIDPKVKTGSSEEIDYFLKTLNKDSTYDYDGYGFDRGHLAPSADFSWSNKALSESYFYSNMTPQRPDFNRDGWAKLENLLRSYIYNNPENNLIIATGPVLHEQLPKVKRSKNKVTIPEYHYKIALDLKEKKAIGFLMPNEKCGYSLSHYAASIDSIESLTGIDFFHQIDDTLEQRLEKMNDFESWFPEIAKKEVDVLNPLYLPDGAYNSVQAKMFVGKNKPITICGTVVSTKLSNKGNTFLNLDKSFPNQIFTVTIFKKNLINFSYEPHIELKDLKVCVTGKISEYNDTPSMIVNREKSIEILDVE